MIVWLWLGCAGVPLMNQPPILDRVNDTEHLHNWDAQTGYLMIPAPEGEVVDLTITAHDPEGDPFEIWFPGAAGTIDFDPAARSGTWTLPTADAEGRLQWSHSVDILLFDPEHPEVSSLFELSFQSPPDSGASDTGG